MYNIAPYCTFLHCTVLYCTALYSTALHCTVLYCTALYYTVLRCTLLHCSVLYCTALYRSLPINHVFHPSQLLIWRPNTNCTSLGANQYCRLLLRGLRHIRFASRLPTQTWLDLDSICSAISKLVFFL